MKSIIKPKSTIPKSRDIKVVFEPTSWINDGLSDDFRMHTSLRLTARQVGKFAEAYENVKKGIFAPSFYMIGATITKNQNSWSAQIRMSSSKSDEGEELAKAVTIQIADQIKQSNLLRK